MNMKYDTTFKELFPDVKVLFKLLTNSNVLSIENIEFPGVQQRRADLIATLENNQLLHLELQSDNDEKMLWRELEYCGLIAQRYQQVPFQIVLYIGEQTPRFEAQINTADLTYRYHVINIKDLDCTALLQSESLSDNLLALLGKLQDKAAAFQKVMNKIAKLPQNKRADTLEKLAILVGLRPKELPLLLEKEKYMSISIDLEQNPIFVEIFNRYTQRGEQRGIQIGEQRGEQRGIQIGEQRGEQYGKKSLLQKQLEKRFGILPLWAVSRLEQATSQQLEQWSLQIFDAQHLEDIFDS
jgi:predicted transposase YdaD